MIYTPLNVGNNVTVVDMDTLQELKDVLSIDTKGTVTKYLVPLAPDANGEFKTEDLKFRSIYAIPEERPELIQCYGRL